MNIIIDVLFDKHLVHIQKTCCTTNIRLIGVMSVAVGTESLVVDVEK